MRTSAALVLASVLAAVACVPQQDNKASPPTAVPSVSVAPPATTVAPPATDTAAAPPPSAAPSASAAASSAPPARGECTTDGDCHAQSDYCGKCGCLALSRGMALAKCSGTTVQCLVDPCRGKHAVCRNGACALEAGDGVSQ